jgi:6-pyruvoyltetrahydropterin/6-carboxytetrahydropterin synthase
MLITCTRRIQFCAGHRVYNHESKCRNLHGHNYVALFTAFAPLDDLGRVIDFSVLKDKIGGWIDAYWDHGFLLWENDPAQLVVKQVEQQKLYLMPWNPTAENMARYLLERVCPKVLDGTGVAVTGVRVWETENCYADSSNEPIHCQ